MNEGQVSVITKDENRSDFALGKPYVCILFNDNDHGMDEVAVQIIKAINCSSQKAINIMLEAHEKGRAIVVTAHRERCEHVSAILEEIRLGTKVEPAP